MAAAPFRLNPALDPERLARAFKADSRLHIPDFLVADDAERLLAALVAEQGWKLVMNQGSQRIELDRSLQANLTPEKKSLIDEAVYAAAEKGFQFRYETLRAPTAAAERAAAPTELNTFARFMSDESTLAFLRNVTGATDISFADAQATSYGPGHFLTAHDDDAPDQGRRIAYVYNLTRQWNADWGGLLTFHDNGSRVVTSLVPAFNALNLFAVPQLHSVGFVAPFAPCRRYSVTGWLRAGANP